MDSQKRSSARRRTIGSLMMPPLSSQSGAYLHWPTAQLAMSLGVISSVSYTNPHIFFTVDVPLKGGGTVSWTIETESISLSRKKGLTRAKMPIGGRVTVTGWQSRSGGPAMGLATYRLRRGRTITIRRTPR